MNAKNNDARMLKNRTSLEGSDRVDNLARKTTLAVLNGTFPSNVRGLPATAAQEAQMCALVCNPHMSRASKIAALSTCEDVASLVDVATSEAPLFARRSALQRIDEVLEGKPLEEKDLQRLVAGLAHKELIAFTVALMDVAGYDWCAYGDEALVGSLGVALHECQSLHETILLEDAFAQLINARPDLGRNLRACSPGKLHLRAMYAPLVVNNVVYVDLTKENNVA